MFEWVACYSNCELRSKSNSIIRRIEEQLMQTEVYRQRIESSSEFRKRIEIGGDDEKEVKTILKITN